MIQLRNLLNEETFTATNKASGKTSVFKSKDSRDAAIKAGTHTAKKDSSSDKGSETPKVNIFDNPKKSTKSISQSDVDSNLGDSVEFDDYLDNNEGVFSKEDFNELKSLKSNWQQLEADLVDAEMDDDDELMDELETEMNNTVNDIHNVLGKYLDKSKKTPTPKPKNKRGEGNSEVNIAANKLAEKAGFTPQKLGKEKFREVMLQSAVKALKFQYRREARELVAALEGKPEFAKRVDYPNDSDPKYDEKMDYIKNNTADGSIYMNASDDVDSYSFDVLQSSKYFAPDAVDAIANTLRINGFGEDADLVQSVLNPNNKEKKNENKIQSMKLKNLLNEASDKPSLDSRTGLIYYFDIPFTSEDVTELLNGSKSILNAKFTSNRQFEIQPMVFIKDKVNGGNHTFSVSQIAILGAFYNKNKNNVASRKDF